jgi:hypothetical protein
MVGEGGSCGGGPETGGAVICAGGIGVGGVGVVPSPVWGAGLVSRGRKLATPVDSPSSQMFHILDMATRTTGRSTLGRTKKSAKIDFSEETGKKH